jgi:hypothetical protein
MTYLLFWGITQYKFVVTDVLGHSFGPIFEGQAWLLRMGPVFSQNVSNYQSMLDDIPEEQRCQYALVLLIFDSVEY